MTVRVRLACRPTGVFGADDARLALLNQLHARRHDGVLVVRVQDTGAAGEHPEWTEGVLSALDWLGIERGTYEGPYPASAYAAEHQAAATRLYGEGRAYYCDCTRERVAGRTGDGRTGYDGHCRERGLGPGEGRALRLRTPDEGETVVADLVRGDAAFAGRLVEDFVIARGDGTATSLLAEVVDDLSTRITHVIRGEDQLPDAPRQQLLWEALGEQPPVWAHVPGVAGARPGLEELRDAGYLAAAVRNYLMLLGWTPPGDREVVPWQVVEREFRLADLTRTPAVLDVTKLRVFNGEYVRALDPAEFAAVCAPWLTGTGTIAAPPWRPEAFDVAAFTAVAPLAQTRVAVLSEIVDLVDFLFLDAPVRDPRTWPAAVTGDAGELLDAAAAAFAALPAWTADALRAALADAGRRRGLPLGRAQEPVRVAVTGRPVGLPLFESLEVLGRDRALARLAAARTAPAPATP